MANICLYFHLPLHKKLHSFGIFDLGRGRSYFDEVYLKKELQLIEEQGFALLLDCIAGLSSISEARAVCGLVFPGTFWEAVPHFKTDIWKKIKAQLSAKKADLLATPYYQSLNFLIDRSLLEREVDIFQEKIKEIQGRKSAVFVHTDLLYNDFLAYWAKTQNLGLLMAPWVAEAIGDRNPYQLFHAPHSPETGILMPDKKLSHAIESQDLKQEELYQLLADYCTHDNLLTLGFDLTKLAREPQRFRNLTASLLRIRQEGKANIYSPEVVAGWDKTGGVLSIPDFHSIHEKEDTSPWLENALQKDVWLSLYSNLEQIRAYPFLQDADYFLQMGEKHPDDREFLRAYRHFRAILTDINLKKSNKSF